MNEKVDNLIIAISVILTASFIAHIILFLLGSYIVRMVKHQYGENQLRKTIEKLYCKRKMVQLKEKRDTVQADPAEVMDPDLLFPSIFI